MVAQSQQLDRFSTLPSDYRDGRYQLVRFTVRDVQVLLQHGIIPEDASTELLNGFITLKDRGDSKEEGRLIGTKHMLCVKLLASLARQIETSARHVQTQQPLMCSDDNLPEPDFTVLRGNPKDYVGRYPTSDDAFCVIEVADSSYERDVGEKLHAYARGGVEQYVVLNLRVNKAEVFTKPDRSNGTYSSRVIVNADQMLELRVGANESIQIKLSDVLP